MAYNMNHRHRGYCLIIINEKFKPHTNKGERRGITSTLPGLQDVFISLGFLVKVHIDLDVNEIKEIINDLAKNVDHTDCDALVVLFSSHGDYNHLYGTDGSFKTSDLYQQFQPTTCRSLAGKPKIFFIDANRGEFLTESVFVNQRRKTKDRPCAALNTATPAHVKKRDKIDLEFDEISDTSDFLISWSTSQDCFSWRNTTHGSWFQQSLLHVLKRDASHDDLLSMMTSVNRYLTTNFESNCPEIEEMHGKKQSSNFVSTLMGKVYFPPKD